MKPHGAWPAWAAANLIWHCLRGGDQSQRDPGRYFGLLRATNETLVALLDAGQVLGHPFVTGELALGNLRRRELVIGSLQDLPQANTATNEEVLQFIHRHALYGIGIGYVDAHLLASTRVTAGAALWTRDKRLQGAANKLGFGMAESK